MSKASATNRFVRRAARILPSGNPIRSGLSAAWSKYLLWRGEPIQVGLQGTKVWLHPDQYRFSEDFEKDALGSFKKLLEPGIIFWDVGANIGIYSLFALNYLGGKVSIRSWEPNPIAFAYLETHLKQNALSVEANAPVPVFEAIGEEWDATLELLAPEETVYSRVLMPGEASTGQPTLQVRSHSLDYWVQKLSCRPHLIKIDVEGAEALILRSPNALLDGSKKDAPLVLLSAHPYTLNTYGSSVEDLDKKVRVLGYEVLDLGGRLTSISGYAEYWLVPPSRVSEVALKLRSPG